MSRKSFHSQDVISDSLRRRQVSSERNLEVNRISPPGFRPVISSTKHLRCVQPIVFKKHPIAKPKKTTQSEMVFGGDNSAYRSFHRTPDAEGIGDSSESVKRKPQRSSRSLTQTIRSFLSNENKTKRATSAINDRRPKVILKSKSLDKIKDKTSNTSKSKSCDKLKYDNKAPSTIKTGFDTKDTIETIIQETSPIEQDTTGTTGDKVQQFYRNENLKPGTTGDKLQQFYRNENFKQRQESMDNIHKKNIFLEPIVEATEKTTETSNIDNNQFFTIYSDTDTKSNISVDPNDDSIIEKIKEFRSENYFECHSAKTRLRRKPHATALGDHKCTYRFYLNDRLFPVPLGADHTNKIRCTECHLPLNYDKSNIDKDLGTVNGAIQAKVQIGRGKKLQDILLMVPVKEPLIIPERRKMPKVKNPDIIYFGVIKLTHTGHSVFKENQPLDSFALRYQKGYKEIYEDNEFSFDKLERGDVIVI